MNEKDNPPAAFLLIRMIQKIILKKNSFEISIVF